MADSDSSEQRRLAGRHPRCCAIVQIKDLGCKAGVVLNPATPLSSIEHVLEFVGVPSHHCFCVLYRLPSSTLSLL